MDGGTKNDMKNRHSNSNISENIATKAELNVDIGERYIAQRPDNTWRM